MSLPTASLEAIVNNLDGRVIGYMPNTKSKFKILDSNENTIFC